MKKTYKRIVSLALVFVMMFAFSANAVAEENSNVLDEISDAFADRTASVLFPALSTRMISNQSILLPYAGMSCFITFPDTVNEDEVEYFTDDVQVAIAYDGRILATGKGTTNITVTYEGMEVEYVVVVNKELTEKEIRDMESVAGASSKNRTGSVTPDSAIEKAIDMAYVHWTPEQTVVGWLENGYFYAGTRYTGIPYSQTNFDVDDIEFLEKLETASDFYANTAYVAEKEYVGPRYGNDCAGFVSFCWGIERQTTKKFLDGIIFGTYGSCGSNYSELRRGDAVTNSGHCFIVSQNYTSPPSGSSKDEAYCVCYEQTPIIASYSFWTYTELENEGYVGVSYFD